MYVELAFTCHFGYLWLTLDKLLVIFTELAERHCYDHIFHRLEPKGGLSVRLHLGWINFPKISSLWQDIVA